MSGRMAVLVAVTWIAGASPLTAQADSAQRSLACASRAQGTRVSIGGDERRSPSTTLDTTIILSIDSHTWTRDNVDAGVALGANDTAGSRSASWSICTGASVNLRQVTATLHGIHGQVHLKIDPSALSALVTPTAAPTRR